jgi:hypothetical protein
VGTLRVWFPHLVAAALVLVVALLVVSSTETEAKRFLVTDSFNAPDGSAPDVNKWVVEDDAYGDMVQISDARLMTWSQSSGHAYCTMARPFSNDNITLTVEFSVDYIDDRCFDISFITGDGTTWNRLLTVKYEHDVWGWERQWEFDVQKYHSTVRNLQAGQWYVAELDIYRGQASFTVWNRDTSANLWFFENLTLESPEGRNLVSFGVDAVVPGSQPKTHWDNLTLVDPVAPPNVQPRWSSVPNLEATEDVHMFHDFQRYIVDDQDPWEITLTSPSEYVVNIDGFEVDFLFPNNVTDPRVILVVFDGYVSIPRGVSVTVTPVNDPPMEAIPDTMTAVEGITSTIDLEAYIWDIDNPPRDLQLLLSSSYIKVKGFLLEVHCPEGTPDFTVELGITDGYATIWVQITFLVTPMDDPPALLPIDDITVVEDVPYVLDITTLVSDPDDPVDTLVVTVSTESCTVDGLVITFLYTQGGMSDLVIVRVSDGIGHSQQTFNVLVLAINDAPVIGDIPVIDVYEDETTYVSLADWISDEEQPAAQLLIRTEHPGVLSAVGLGLNVLFTVGGLQDPIPFNLSDGIEIVEGSVVINVLEVNDQPMITGIGEERAPYFFRLASKTHREYDILATDADDTGLRFSVESGWEGFSVASTRLIIDTGHLDRGDYTGYLNVYDNRGGTHRVKLTAHVVQRSELPLVVTIISPENHTAFDAGARITFRVHFIDGGNYLEEPVTATWTSDMVGKLGTVDMASGGNLSIGSLPEGSHVIRVTVGDGQIAISRWIIIEVGDVSSSSDTTGMGALCSVFSLLAIIIVMGIVVGLLVKRAGSGVEVEPSKVGKAPAPVDDPSPAPSTRRDARAERDRKAQRERVERAREEELVWDAQVRKDEERREARIRAEMEKDAKKKAESERRFRTETEPSPVPVPDARVHAVTPPTSPPPRAVRRALPTEQEMELQRKVIIEAIGRVPGGLPSSLSLYDGPTIAKRVIRGRKKWAKDGRLLAFIQGEWYYADPADREFMKVYDEL